MQLGYLSIETHSDRPGLLRMALSARCPAVPERRADGPLRVRYIARFNDGEAALMHVHQLLRGRLVDVDSGIYRGDLVTAVTAIESLGLPHGRIYLDPQIDGEHRSLINARVLSLGAKRRRLERFWNAVGYIALGFLMLQAVIGFFR
jgi:hypothetical protein